MSDSYRAGLRERARANEEAQRGVDSALERQRRAYAGLMRTLTRPAPPQRRWP